MKVAIMQPYFFPYIGYWQLINAVDRFVVLDDVNYIKGGWVNRNRLLLGGKDHLFTLPLNNASPNRLIHEITIANLSIWSKKFIRTLETEYRKAPNFDSVFELIKDCLNYNNLNLSAYLTNSIKKICAYLCITTRIIETSSGYNTGTLKNSDRLFSICKQESAEVYINPIGGQVIYEKSDFRKEGITLSFIKSDQIIYRQFKNQFQNDFIQNLSIIDIMMFNSKEKIKEMLNKYELI